MLKTKQPRVLNKGFKTGTAILTRHVTRMNCLASSVTRDGKSDGAFWGLQVNGVQLSVQVLNDAYWPISSVDKFPVPGKSSEFVRCITKFEDFYRYESGTKLAVLCASCVCVCARAQNRIDAYVTQSICCRWREDTQLAL